MRIAQRVLLKKLPEKLEDPGKFLIPCNFPGMVQCFALADLGASINLMPMLIWKKLSLPSLTPTLLTLELADRSTSRPIGIAEDIFVNVGKFNFPADFVVVDFDADPRVPLILGRGFLRTGRALIDVYDEEITLRVGNEAVTFNLDQTARYSSNHNHVSVNRVDVIDEATDRRSILKSFFVLQIMLRVAIPLLLLNQLSPILPLPSLCLREVISLGKKSKLVFQMIRFHRKLIIQILIRRGTFYCLKNF
jgi:hypothetical protein